jgi:hypothetical protein
MLKAAVLLRNPWTWVGILAFVIILFVAVRKMAPLIAINRQVPLPSDPLLSSTESQLVRELSIRLQKDMIGINVFSSMRDRDAWAQLMSMPDRLFISVYNDFNTLNFSTGKGTFTKWVTDEFVWWDTGGLTGRDNVLDRLASLNLQ